MTLSQHLAATANTSAIAKINEDLDPALLDAEIISTKAHSTCTVFVVEGALGTRFEVTEMGAETDYRAL